MMTAKGAPHHHNPMEVRGWEWKDGVAEKAATGRGRRCEHESGSHTSLGQERRGLLLVAEGPRGGSNPPSVPARNARVRHMLRKSYNERR